MGLPTQLLPEVLSGNNGQSVLSHQQYQRSNVLGKCASIFDVLKVSDISRFIFTIFLQFQGPSRTFGLFKDFQAEHKKHYEASLVSKDLEESPTSHPVVSVSTELRESSAWVKSDIFLKQNKTNGKSILG